MDKDLYCVIMAGGIGSRFWPMSRTRTPKQFMDILGTGRTLIQHTFKRFQAICPTQNILIVSNVEYRDLILEQLPEIHPSQLLLEPLRKNTAPCIAYANQRIATINPDATIIVAPSDHLILDEIEFLRIIREGVGFVRSRDVLLTLGIRPNRPETGYGYIQVNDLEDFDGFPNLHKVKTFTEKPNLELAQIFLDSGDFFWNSGVFVWSLTSIQRAYERHLPDMQGLFADGRQLYGTDVEEAFIKQVYGACDKISIDYGLMEKADNVYVLCADFGWSDLGTWGSLYSHLFRDDYGNAIGQSLVLAFDSSGNIIHAPEGKLTVVQGLDDYIIINTDDVLLICKKEDEQQIRLMVDEVKMKFGGNYI
ncbi:MAG: mannose-1-phosphate guanylyltransferase [Bacteroidales bacterium]|nr:mannose-1-phosphate guanylyltransferase [Bacteroidales bacterium]MDD2570631.1 mannose-1-phosphate guanylyltransferase [Bacteroidales bacterium]MDD2812901.1 mannose-1-phosphate guanylyltransferase [Bacteroidales bacterium]MDD3384671.1 mannose-1-phosphate guanylyltransferase [Bacteroidales bacterium]MDD3810776.1 mannose-1-phosphate guanylyltransferase [Bacteroidales bacterium]